MMGWGKKKSFPEKNLLGDSEGFVDNTGEEEGND